MKLKFPHTIENRNGEKIIFQTVEQTPTGDRVIVDAFCSPKAGPAMHTHFQQDEELTVISGKMGYQLKGESPKFASVGETVLFKRGIPHKFWAEGSQPLHCKGWIQPANTIVFFLSAVYASQNKTGTAKPDPFDGAYLLTRYASEYDMPEIPYFVKKVIFPLTVFIGKLFGKYRQFRDAPPPL